MPQRTVCKNVGGGASVPTELHVEPRYEMHFKDLAVLYAINLCLFHRIWSWQREPLYSFLKIFNM